MSNQYAWSICTILFAVAILFFCNTATHALTFDFVGPDAEQWFDEFVNHPNVEMGGGDAGWHLTENGLTTDDNLSTGHQRIGFSEDWTDYTLESKYQYVQQGAHQEAHLYVRWNEGEIYGLRGEIKDQTLTVEFFKDNKWLAAGEVKYPGPHKTGGIGVGRATAEVAWQYLRVNGEGIPADAQPVEALNKMATTWAKLKRP